MTTTSLTKQIRALFILGLMLCFISLFLEWYIYQVYDSSHRLLAYWSYNPLMGWLAPSSKNTSLSNSIRPYPVHIPIALTIFYIFMLLFSAFIAIFRDVEQYPHLEQLTVHTYINLFLLLLMLFYIFAFPVFYLIPNNLYFPFLYVKDNDADLTYQYTIGPGYGVHLLGFILAFPYVLFYYTTVMNFQSQKDSAKTSVSKYIKTVQDSVDIDKLIAKEQLKIKLGESYSDNLEEIDINYMRSPKRRVRP